MVAVAQQYAQAPTPTPEDAVTVLWPAWAPPLAPRTRGLCICLRVQSAQAWLCAVSSSTQFGQVALPLPSWLSHPAGMPLWQGQAVLPVLGAARAPHPLGAHIAHTPPSTATQIALPCLHTISFAATPSPKPPEYSGAW
ncbi:hypothetical protein C0995_002044 [Termitomyces sp. Mi166|nr:hypothetical protein C0995_002044 [Termitomyces sp. Mi166\